MPTYTHESGEAVVTVPGSPLHRQMVAKAAADGSGWSFGERPAPTDDERDAPDIPTDEEETP